MIKELTAALLGNDRSPRKVHCLRESLRALVRLAKVEQMTQMRQSIRLALSSPTSSAERRKSKAECKRLLETCQAKQIPL
jgi:hypothetical protein